MVINSKKYQQNKQSPLNKDGHECHQYQQNKQSPLNKVDHQFKKISTK
jgi:hypothetical protein